MKYLKKIKVSYKFMLSLCLLFFASSSCTKYMDGLNLDQKKITDKQLEMDASEGGKNLPGMMLQICGVLPAYNELYALVFGTYAGYTNLPSPINNNVNDQTYFRIWSDYVWNYQVPNVLDPWVQMKKKGFDTKYPDLYAIAVILKVIVAQRLVDSYGPFPYALYGTAANVEFGSEQEAYYLFFTELTSAVAALRKANTDNPTAYKARFTRFDKSHYGGDYTKWIKVANTVRLRCAMRISGVDPAKAQIEAEAAVNDPGGVLTSAEGSFEVNNGDANPLVTSTRVWQEEYINEAIVSILGGYNDPRLATYAYPSAFNGKFLVIRSGCSMTQSAAQYLSFSLLNFDTRPYVKIIDVAESYFLRAEGALKGWNMGGTSQNFYEQGITASFNSNGVSGIQEYLNNSTLVPNAYVDPLNPLNNAPSLISITIKWDESATLEQKLERIITQKWIAMYPEGGEAWSEFRRTGYPKLWPVVENNSSPSTDVPAGTFIKRLKYPVSVYSSSSAAVTAAVNKYLNGKDLSSTHIWWDVK